jgi:hypothetical protein
VKHQLRHIQQSYMLCKNYFGEKVLSPLGMLSIHYRLARHTCQARKLHIDCHRGQALHLHYKWNTAPHHLPHIYQEGMMCIHSNSHWARVRSHIWSTLHSQKQHIFLIGRARIDSELRWELSQPNKANTPGFQMQQSCQPNMRRIRSDFYSAPLPRCKVNTVRCQVLHSARAGKPGNYSRCLLECSLLDNENTAKPHQLHIGQSRMEYMQRSYLQPAAGKFLASSHDKSQHLSRFDICLAGKHRKPDCRLLA